MHGIRRAGREVRLAFLLCGMLIGSAVGLYAGCEYGQFRALHNDYERRYEEERQLVAPILAADAAFLRIVTVNFPVAGICLAGYVPSQKDYDRLREKIIRLFGESRVGHIMGDVLVEPNAERDSSPDCEGKS